MKTVKTVLSSFLLVLLLAACGGAAEESGPATDGSERAALKDDYADALPVPAQLALGSLKLEETDLAIEQAQAAELLLLWQAYQSLSVSDKAAEAEVTAVVNQIQDTMAPEQVEAIAGMRLTTDEVTPFMEAMRVELGRGGFGGSREGVGGTGGGAIPGGGRLSSGGFPGGGFPGGGQGLPGAGVPGTNTDLRATRAAELGGSEDDLRAAFMNRALVNGLIQSLQEKTGEAVERPARSDRTDLLNEIVWNVVSETTGISVETLQTEAVDGATLAEVITANGGDLEAAEAALLEAFIDGSVRLAQDPERFVSDLLNSSPGGSSE